MVFRSLTALLVTLALGLGVGTASAFAPTDAPSYEMPIPMDMASPTFQHLSAEQAGQTLTGWNAFAQAGGSGWFVAAYRADLGTPAALMGPGIEIASPSADAAALRDAARAFVRQHESVLHANAAELSEPEVINLGDRTALIFGQTYEGLEVVDGRVDLYVKDGKVFMMGSEFFPDVRVATTPAISGQDAATRAVGDIPFNPLTDHFEGTPRLVVYPLVLQGAPRYYLAYEVKFQTAAPTGYWWAYVDASDGQVLSRVNHAAHLDIPTTVSSDVQLNYETDPITRINSAWHWVRTNNQDFYTDANGFVNLTVPNNQQYNINSELRGRYSNVNRGDGPDASWSGSGSPGNPVSVLFSDANAQQSERNAYYSENRIHDWLKAVDPTFTSMDFAIPANVNLDSGTCNAFWNGSSINFYLAGGGCVNTALISDVVMHEYGHGITQYTYSPNSPPTSSGMGEAFSDIVAQTNTNDHLMGRGWNDNGNGYIRNALNTRQYPGTECGGQVHCLGEILMGAMWKTRVNLTNTLGYEPGRQYYDQIMRAAHLTKQRSMPNFLTRLLMADDDNASLGDGTPNWYDICDAFEIHNLPCPPLTSYIRFTHSPLADQVSTSNPIEVVSLIEAISSGSLIPDSTRVWYSTDLGQTWSSVLMTPTGVQNQFRGYIPAQNCGTLVDYYLRARTTTGVAGTEPLRAPGKGVHQFMVGPTTVALNDTFESNLGWTVGAPGDNATQGIWERVDPVGKTNPIDNEVVQPEDDHTNPGTLCFVTDGRGGYYENYDVDGGATTILSPTYNWEGFSGVGKIEFWGFFANVAVIDDTLRASVSGDNGSTWFDVVKISGKEANAWTRYAAYFTSDQVAFTNQMRFRFQIADYNASLTEGAVDDVIIKYTPCTATGVEPVNPLPTRFVVENSVPNPMSNTTTIRFAMPRSGSVAIDLYDAGGRVVRSLARGPMDAGYHSVRWDGKDDSGRAVSSGVYYYRVQADGQEQTQKLLIVR